MSYRPPLPRRWWLYCAVAYLAPSVVLQIVPAADVPYRDLIWLLTLVPAYVLSLHYGMHGAVSGLVMGTILFTAIQFLVAWSLEPEDWRITVPIYVAYGAIAISVGWLSEQLHLFYAIRHEVNNALAAIIAEGQLLEQDGRLTHPEDVRSLENIIAMARRVNDSMEKLATLTHAPVTDYAAGVKMIDITKL